MCDGIVWWVRVGIWNGCVGALLREISWPTRDMPKEMLLTIAHLCVRHCGKRPCAVGCASGANTCADISKGGARAISSGDYLQKELRVKKKVA